MKTKKILILIILLCVLVGCKTNGINSGGEKTHNPTHNPEVFPTDSYVTRITDDRYNDKNTIVWVFDALVLSSISLDRLYAFNDALLAKGADFILEIVALESYRQLDYLSDIDATGIHKENIIIYNQNMHYFNNLKTFIDNGNQADIIFTGVTHANLLGINDSYMLAYQNDLLLPLDDILPDTIKNAFSSNYWETLKINSNIYGFRMDPIYAYSSLLLVKNEPIPYGITRELITLLPLLDQMPEEFPLSLPNDITTISEHLGYRLIAASIAIDNSGRSFNLFEDQSFLTYISDAFSLFEKGYIYSETNSSLYFTNYPEPSVIVAGRGNSNDIIDMSKWMPLFTTHIFDDDLYLDTARSAIGIYNQSQYPQEALTLFSWLLSDRELADLLVFGVLDVDFQVENGIVVNSGFNMLPLLTGLYSFTSPTDDDVIKKGNALYEHNERASISNITGFRFNSKEYEETLYKLNELINIAIYSDIIETDSETIFEVKDTPHSFINGGDSDYIKTLTWLNEEMKNAGLINLLDEISRQYLVWNEIVGR
ncbi:MAG: hypothetical protein LBC71_04290 [Oscillospiraceae bacterium]|nr:hypothetical protein [Oscillospiraceae bacterium]